MTDDRALILTITRIEADYLRDLVEQFISLLNEYSEETTAEHSPPATPGAGAITGAFGGADAAPNDPALARLMPDAYASDPEASIEFRQNTENELVDRRVRDARRVLAGLDMRLNEPVSDDERRDQHTDPESSSSQSPFDVVLDAADGDAWMRTLAAVRLVVASRLGIETDEDDAAARDADDEGRFGVYDWLGYRLEGLVQAIDAGEARD